MARGLAYGDFDRDGDLDLLLTTNQGPAYLYRNDVTSGARSLRLRLTGTKSNRDAIGAVVRVTTPEGTQSRMVKTGSSYLSQSELTLTFGLGARESRYPRGDRMAQRPVAGVPGRTRGRMAMCGGKPAETVQPLGRAGKYQWTRKPAGAVLN